MDPDVAEIRNQQNSGGDTSGGSAPDDGGGSLSLDGLGLSKKHLLILAAVVVIALVLWKLTGDGGGSSGGATDDMEEVVNGDLSTEATVEDEEIEGDVQLTIPADASQDQKDAAILGYLEETGRIGAGS